MCGGTQIPINRENYKTLREHLWNLNIPSFAYRVGAHTVLWRLLNNTQAKSIIDRT